MKKIAVLLLCLFAVQFSKAQEDGNRVITTGVPFLLIAADARSASMGDQGVATAPDAFSQQYNPAKYAFATDKFGGAVSYTPYLTDIVNDISLAQINFYNHFNERMSWAASLRYFGLGEIELRKTYEETPRIVKPNELALDVSYALRLSDHFAMSVAGRYIRSNLKIPDENNDAKAASSFAVDVAGYYQSEEIAFSEFNGKYKLGFNFQNLGPKISYASDDNENNSNFLPANMKLGGAFDFILDDYNKVSLNLEFNKLLVPTPQEINYVDINGDGEVSSDERAVARNQSIQDYQSIGWTSGIFKSFGDAPDGFSEELKEFTYAVGAEYMYQESFGFRLGYFNESPIKGARRFFALGAGFKYNIVKVDVSYLFSASKVKNPLENTLRFSLSFAFGDKYDEY
jgi:hypothetical protein